MPVLFVTKFHYTVDHETLRKVAMDRELEDNNRDYHWKRALHTCSISSTRVHQT
jgi:hypothetical protein